MTNDSPTPDKIDGRTEKQRAWDEHKAANRAKRKPPRRPYPDPLVDKILYGLLDQERLKRGGGDEA